MDPDAIFLRTSYSNKIFPRYTGPIVKLPSRINLLSPLPLLPPIANTKNKIIDRDREIGIERKNKLGGLVGKKSEFWVENPTTLLENFDIVPNEDMTDGNRLNSMTRIIILISAIMFGVNFQLWWLFLSLGLIVVVTLWYLIKYRDYSYSREYLRSPNIVVPIKEIIGTRKPIAEKYVKEERREEVHNQRINIISLR